MLNSQLGDEYVECRRSRILRRESPRYRDTLAEVLETAQVRRCIQRQTRSGPPKPRDARLLECSVNLWPTALPLAIDGTTLLARMMLQILGMAVSGLPPGNINEQNS